MKGLQRATEFLTRLLDNKECLQAGRLPPVARCARLAGVSKDTISRAVAALAKQGRIRAEPGRGLFIADAGGLPAPPRAPETEALFGARLAPAWQRVKTRMLDDIVKGVFPPGKALPTYKELRERYGAGTLTLKTAVAALSREVNLVPFKRGYAVPASNLSRESVIVYLFPRVSSVSRGNLYPSPRLEIMARQLEKCGMESGVSFRAVQYMRPAESGGAVSLAVRELPLQEISRRNTVLGYIMWHMIEYLHEPELIDWLINCDKPVAIIDNAGDFPRQRLPRSGPLVKCFTVGCSSAAPRIVAQHLLRLGHTHAAYVTLFHRRPWSIMRYAHLRSSFAPGGSVIMVPEFPARGRSPLPQSEILFTHYFGIPKLQYLLEPIADSLPGEMAKLARRFYDGLTPLARQMSLDILNTALATALADRRITALIGANDDIALYALDYLRQRKIKVPQQMSVIGFDDTLESFAEELTSYNFNVEAVTNMVLDHILRPPRGHAHHGAQVVETEGMIMERRTTGPAQS